MPRDLVRTEATERLDKPDLDALQLNTRSDVRSAMAALLFASSTTSRALGGWQVTPNAPPDALVDVAAGTMAGIEQLDDGSMERVVLYGLESTAAVSLDFTGAPAATYGIYIRFVHTPGIPGSRIFWDQDAVQEQVASIDTREVAGWTATRSVLSPGADWILVANVVWNGAAVGAANISMVRNLFFEGQEPAFGPLWGAGPNDRNVNRGLYGIRDLYTWVQAVRAQLEDIIGVGNGWYDAPPTDLSALNAQLTAHLLDSTDPHTALLAQTNLNVATQLNVAGGMVVADASGVRTTRGQSAPLEVGGLLDSNGASAGAGAGSAVEEEFTNFIDLLGGNLTVGTHLRLRAMVSATVAAGVPTLRLRHGAPAGAIAGRRLMSQIISTAAPGSAPYYLLEAEFRVNIAGAVLGLFGYGLAHGDENGTEVREFLGRNDAQIGGQDGTIPLRFSASVQFSVANAGNVATCEWLTLEMIGG